MIKDGLHILQFNTSTEDGALMIDFLVQNHRSRIPENIINCIPTIWPVLGSLFHRQTKGPLIGEDIYSDQYNLLSGTIKNVFLYAALK